MNACTWSCLALLAGCASSADVQLQFTNESLTTSPRGASVLADGTSLRLKMVAVYLTEDIDPATSNNIGASSMIWLNPECDEDISSCNVAGLATADEHSISEYFDFARPTEVISAEIDSQQRSIDTRTYRYARVELCRNAVGAEPSSIPTMYWRGPSMKAELPFSSNDCGRTSIAFDPPLVVVAGDSVTVRLGYHLDQAIVSGPRSARSTFSIAGNDDPDGSPHFFRACADTDVGRDCMDFPNFTPSAVRL